MIQAHSSTKPVLVTGGAGYIGSHTCKLLRAAGFLPVAYDNLSRGNVEAVKWGPLEVGDIADSARLLAAMEQYRPHAVIHFAAFAYVGESMENPALYYRNNVGGTAAVLDAVRQAHIPHFIFSSSCAVYGEVKAKLIAEDTALAPINPYGSTKKSCEELLRECAHAFRLKFTTLRYFNAAGADPDGEIGECHVPETHAVPLLLDAAATGGSFSIYGDDYPTDDGTCIRDYTHVFDLADAHVKALTTLLNGAENAAFNIGTGRGWSVRELVAAAHSVTSRDIQTKVEGRRSGDPAYLIADASRARASLGWRPRYANLSDLIAHAWGWREGACKSWERSRAAADRRDVAAPKGGN